YEALSYTWGDASSPLSIRLDKQDFKVTANLHAALTVLRLPTEPRILWIDAICINQHDNAEKAFQVPLMGMIYSRAATVNIWLGPEEAGGGPNSIFDILDKTKLAGVDGKRLQLRTRGRKRVTIETWKPRLAELKAFSSRPYWTRIWIIQEATLA
ncbi:uncharacterized protein THITE_2033124, partial [Thermothielavioides terrestris NRRL 8126]